MRALIEWSRVRRAPSMTNSVKSRYMGSLRMVRVDCSPTPQAAGQDATAEEGGEERLGEDGQFHAEVKKTSIKERRKARRQKPEPR